MLVILSFLALLAFQGAYAQNCLPEPVLNVTLELNYTLHWVPSANCESTSYLIFIHVDVDNLQYIYNTRNSYLDVSFLDACERFYFEVRASSNNELSTPTVLVSYVPAPSGADLAIVNFVASTQDDATFLNWRVTEKFAHCARGFRLVIRDSISPMPRDIYTDRNNIFLNDLVPCGQYEFAIMAIYNLQSEGPINLINYVAPRKVAPVPVLQSVNLGDTFANVTWSLPSYSVNRCRINGVDVEGLPFFHKTFPVYDVPERPLFTTSLEDLRPDNMYIFRVSTLNDAGVSQILQVGVQTLPSTDSS